MKKLPVILGFIALIYSCEKYPEPGSEILEQFNFIIHGDSQSAEEGSYLEEMVGVQVDLGSLFPDKHIKFYTDYEIIEGGGKITSQRVDADEQGKMLTSWQLGNKINDQLLTGKIFDINRKQYAQFSIKATAYFPHRLNTITRGIFIGIGDMVRDTINQRSMLISGGDFYTYGNNFYNWNPIGFPFNTNIKELEINSKGEVFAAGWNGELYQTKNWGESWQQLGKPIPNNRYHYELTITEDDYIWANKWDHGVFCSKDNGISWQKDTIGLAKQEELGRIYLFADSLHMAISYHNLTILQTSDCGLTWKPINTPEYSLSMYITSGNAIIAQNQGGFHLHKSTDGGKTYREVFAPWVAFGTSSKHCYDKFGSNYYVLAPGGGVWKTKNFENFDEIMRFTRQRNLFIDHIGNIYASGFNYSNAEPDPTLVFPAQN